MGVRKMSPGTVLIFLIFLFFVVRYRAGLLAVVSLCLQVSVLRRRGWMDGWMVR